MSMKQSVVSWIRSSVVIFGIIGVTGFYVEATRHNDGNPLHWQAHAAAYERAFALSDSDHNGALSLPEIDAMYRRAGLKIEGLTEYNIRNGTTSVSLQGLNQSQLERVIESYK